jgi:plasmid stability protein
MTKLTIAMDEGVLERARSRASRQGTSLDALVRSYVESFASGEESREQAVKTLLDLSRKAESGSGGRRWTRDELHER